MYLAKFFHRAPGDDDRELLLIPGSEMTIMGIYMREDMEPGADQYLREDFADPGTAVAAFRRHAAELIASGYMETTHTKYTLRNLLPDPQAKPDWQQGLDDLMLSALGEPLEEQAKRLVALRDTPAVNEPLYLWLAAHHAYAEDRDNDATLRLAGQGRDTIAARRAAKAPHYAWSIRESDLEARALEVLSWAQLRADDPKAALETIEQACKVDINQDRVVQRATILVHHFPERQEEAFEDAFKYHSFGGFEDIMELPAYADYIARRKRKKKSDKGWRWHTKRAMSEAEIAHAEQELGARLPADYRRFLAKHGESELQVRLADDSAELCFYRPTELATQRRNLFNFIARTVADGEEVDAYFRDRYGVAASELLPVAEPSHHSHCLVINLGTGERFGWCFQWDHDDAWELEQAAPSFDAALQALTSGIEKRDATTLNFLGVYLD